MATTIYRHHDIIKNGGFIKKKITKMLSDKFYEVLKVSKRSDEKLKFGRLKIERWGLLDPSPHRLGRVNWLNPLVGKY